MKPSPQAAGAIARGIIARRQAIEKYNKNPNYCIFCNKKIEIVLKEGKHYRSPKEKKFCDRECFHEHQRKINLFIPRQCACGENIARDTNRLTCFRCHRKEITKNNSNISLKELRKRYGTFQFHAKIRGWSRAVYSQYEKPYECLYCGYDHYIEIAHKKPIKDFNEKTLLTEVNHPDNLIALCRNHHWEFDHGLIKLDKQQTKIKSVYAK